MHALLLALAACAPKSPPPEPVVAVDPLSAEALSAAVTELSSDALAGRGTFEPAIEEAAALIAGRFEAAGLQPLPGQEGLLMPVDIWVRGWKPTEGTLRLGDWSEPVAVGQSLRPLPFSDSGSVDAPVVFAGYGVVAPEHEWDDYTGLDVEGKWVLVLRHEPGEADESSVFNGTETTEHALFTTKARRAQERGAVGILVVTDPVNHQGSEDMRLPARYSVEDPAEEDQEREARAEARRAEAAAQAEAAGLPPEPPPPPFYASQLSQAVGVALFAQAGADLSEVQSALDSGTSPAEFSLDEASLSLSIEVREGAERVTAHNVAGVLPGANPEAEWVLVGAHYDHLGAYIGDGDTTYNGADDNASGTAGLMALADAVAADGQNHRSVAFIAFTGEELGLLGSRAVLAQDLLDPRELAFMLNLDMIGRLEGEPLSVTGDAFTPGLTEALTELAEPAGVALDLRGFDYFGNSDHDPFHRAGVPALHVFTGLHDDYHQLSDHADLIDVEGMSDLLTLCLGLVERYAESEARPSRLHRVPWLDAMVESSPDGVTVVEGGELLREGDHIRGVNEVPLSSPYAVAEALDAIDPGAEGTLSVQRGEALLKMPVVRPKPGYLGVYPGALSEEAREALGLPDGEGFVINRVVPEGPAALSGLQDGDVVYGIAGQPVDLGKLGPVLARIGGGETVSVRLIREEERMELELTLGVRD